MGDVPPSPQSAPCVAAYLLLPADPAKAAALRARLVAFQRSQGVPAALYEEHPEDRRRRPKRRRLIGRARRGAICVLCVLRLRHLAATRARVAQLVLRMNVAVVTPSGLRLDPADRVLRWVAHERTEHRRSIKRALDAKRGRGERVGAIPAGLKLAEDGVHLEPDADVQQAIATARRLASGGMSQRQIATTLTEAGYRTRRGRAVTHKQVGRWLRAVP
jgi:hypothetical protein